MRPSVTGSGQKGTRETRPPPRIDPLPPILPEGNGHSVPIQPTEKLIERAQPKSVIYDRSFVSGPEIRSSYRQVEHVKKGAALTDDDKLTRELERLRAENANLNNDRNRLIREYEDKIRLLQSQGLNSGNLSEDERGKLLEEIRLLRAKLADVEADNRNYREVYEQEKKTNDSLRLLLKLREGEQLPPVNSVTHEVMRQQIQEIENKNVLFMIECERLGRIVGELQMENDRLIAKISQGDLRNSLNTIDTDKYLLQNQVREMKIKNDELEYQLSLVRQELDRARSGQQAQQIGSNSSLMLEIENLNAQLRERNARINDLESQLRNLQDENSRIRSNGEQVKRSVLPTDDGMRGVYESRINELIRENESLNEKYKRLENAKLSEIQDIIKQNSLLTKQNAILSEENEKVIRGLKDLETEQSVMGSKIQHLARDLEELERKKMNVNVYNEETPKTTALKNEITTKIQNGYYDPVINYTSGTSQPEYQSSYNQYQYTKYP